MVQNTRSLSAALSNRLTGATGATNLAQTVRQPLRFLRRPRNLPVLTPPAVLLRENALVSRIIVRHAAFNYRIAAMARSANVVPPETQTATRKTGSQRAGRSRVALLKAAILATFSRFIRKLMPTRLLHETGARALRPGASARLPLSPALGGTQTLLLDKEDCGCGRRIFRSRQRSTPPKPSTSRRKKSFRYTC